MISFPLRRVLFVILAVLVITLFHLVWSSNKPANLSPNHRSFASRLLRPKFKWRNLPQRHPVANYTKLPSGPIVDIPRIQADFPFESDAERAERETRLAAVEEAFLHSWEGYKRNAWLQDEVAPLSGEASNWLGGWGATLVDSLDTLWIIGLKKEFATAVSYIKTIDFTTTPLDEINVFETTIRYLGGLLSAYDLSQQQYPVLLEKAVELGDMLYVAFDTPNRMPVTRWNWKVAAAGEEQEPDKYTLLAEVGSLTLEFTRLSQLTNNDKWYDAIARVTDVMHGCQNRTKLPGLLPTFLDAQLLDAGNGNTFNLGGMSDSFYEYLPKQHILIGGRNDQYRDMYSSALEAAKEQLFFQPLNPNGDQMLLTGAAKRNAASHIQLIPRAEHLSCFAGGMVALAAKVFQQTHDLETARQLVEGCLWAYESMPSGIMPEILTAVPCGEHRQHNCTWSEASWYDAVDMHASLTTARRQPPESAQRIIMQNSLPPGMVEIPDSRYNLRPEAIESVFVLYRITGDKSLQDRAWKMYKAINNAARTEIAYAAVNDVTEQQPQLMDSMESFWTAETLKYFYLIFSEPYVVSLDEYVLNTEAHPLLRPK